MPCASRRRCISVSAITAGRRFKKATGRALISFLNRLHADHLVLELAHRPPSDLDALKDVDARIGIGLGVVDIKVNHIETPEEIARAIERAEKVLGPDRVRYVHPDCGFWMLKRSVADRKIAALAKGRDLYLGRTLTRHLQEQINRRKQRKRREIL